jgi:hypothetical protein
MERQGKQADQGNNLAKNNSRYPKLVMAKIPLPLRNKENKTQMKKKNAKFSPLGSTIFTTPRPAVRPQRGVPFSVYVGRGLENRGGVIF